MSYYVDDLLEYLHDYHTGTPLRPATRREKEASREAARTDGGAGVIDDSELSRPLGRRLRRLVTRSLKQGAAY